MLSAFDARPIIEFKQRDKSKIESILSFGDKVLVGLHTGTLRIYRINEPTVEAAHQNGASHSPDEPSSQPNVRPADLLREVEKFSRRAIEQLAIIKEANILISLSDGYVSIHDVQLYALQEQLVKTKGASAFAVTSNIVKDPTTGVPSIVSRLAVAVKRKLLLWSWHDTELSSESPEVTLSAAARTLTWANGTNLLCGLNSGYVMVDVENDKISDVIGPGGIGGVAGQEGTRFGSVGATGMGYMGMGSWGPKPLATRLAEGEILLAKDINTLFVGPDGKALDKRQVPWSVGPEAISFSYPYLISLQPPSKGTLEVRNPDTLSLVQSIPLQNASILHVPQPNVSLAHAGKGSLIASDRCIWRLASVDYHSQVEQLIGNGELDEAISLLGLLEDALVEAKQETLREVKMQKAQKLFGQRKYRQSLDLFTEVSAPAERVIKLYPRIVSGDLAPIDDAVASDNESVPETNANHESGTLAQNGDLAKPADDTKRSAVGKLKAESKKNASDTSSIRSWIRGDVGEGSDTGSVLGKHSETVSSDKPLEGKDLQTAVLELCTFLVDTRTKLQRYLNPDGSLKDAVPDSPDPTNGTSNAAFDSLLVTSSPNDVDREQKLRDTAKLVDTTLFRSYMLARPTLAGSLFRIPNFCDPDVVNEKLLESGRYNDLVDFFYGKKLHRPALELLQRFGQANEGDMAPTLRGPKRTVGYLQNLPPEMIDLILEFSEWPLRRDPEFGMEIFVTDSENAETLPREKVVSFLQGIDLKLAVKYLEHLIHELNDLTPDFHNRLVGLYLERLKRPEDEKGAEYGDFQSDRERTEWREKLLSFLRASQQYSLARSLGLIPRDDSEFYEARAVVLSKMGQHKQALEIYVFKLKDHEKAEEYCNRFHLSKVSPIPTTEHSRALSEPDHETPPSIYHTLLSLYLNPPPPQAPNWEPALNLLSRHGSRLPASSTLDLIPSSLPIKDLESYFRGRIRAATSTISEGRVVIGLRKTEMVESQALLLLGDENSGGKGGRNRRVVVGEDR
ncbi:MAG: Vacuolar morphogenesis protein 6 [Geoglossum umbratile]|nr:MAG: Vacuolar morphogenesis protein 6 [Geoglossum umbratile]